MADQAHSAQERIFDANGDPVPGALINVYASGTLVRIDVWLDSDATILATNPVVADANGAVPQVFVSEAANIVVTTALGATLYSLDPAPLSPTSGAGAASITFAPTVNVPFATVQTAIEGVDASWRALIVTGGLGVTGDATLLAGLDATTTASGTYRFSAATTGTFPSGVVAADTGLVLITRQSATLAVMELYALGRAFRRVLSTTWGAWSEVIVIPMTAVQGDIIRRGASGWERVPKGTAGQALVMNDTASDPVWGSASVLLGTIATTSGTSQALGSLVLAPYKSLRLIINGVSGSASINLALDGIRCSQSSGSAAAVLYGTVEMDLSTGVFSGGAYTQTNNAESYHGKTSYTNATTSITISATGGDFDAGSVLVYGIR